MSIILHTSTTDLFGSRSLFPSAHNQPLVHSKATCKNSPTAPSLPSPPPSPLSTTLVPTLCTAAQRPKICFSQTLIVHETWSLEEYPDRADDSPVVKMKYNDIAELMAFKSLMRRQHALIAPNAHVPTLESMDELGL